MPRLGHTHLHFPFLDILLMQQVRRLLRGEFSIKIDGFAFFAIIKYFCIDFIDSVCISAFGHHLCLDDDALVS